MDYLGFDLNYLSFLEIPFGPVDLKVLGREAFPVDIYIYIYMYIYIDARHILQLY